MRLTPPVRTCQVNPHRALRGWCAYFRPGVSTATFADLARHTVTLAATGRAICFDEIRIDRHADGRIVES